MSTPHLAIKFPSIEGDIITVHVDQKIARKCCVASLHLEPMKLEVEKHRKKVKGKEESQSVNVIDLDPRMDHAQVEPKGDVVQIELRGNTTPRSGREVFMSEI